MNRNRYRLVFNTTLGMMVPVAETARCRSKSGGGQSDCKAASTTALALAGVLLGSPVWAQLPVPSAGVAIPNFVTAGQAAYQVNGSQAFVNQVGNKAILNWQSFNVSPGHNVQFRQVDNLTSNNLVQGANFTSLNRIHDINPSVIAGSISQAAGQKANVILVNSNGIAFMGGSQVNLNQFTASTLDIADTFVLDSLLTNNTLTPQFEKALDGGEARGFVKVFENARISAGSFGRVMLIAPTVVNRGKVEAPDGQVIAAAGSRVFLRSASGQDDNVRGLLVEVDSPVSLDDFDTSNASVKDGMLDGQTVSLANAAEDKLGHVTNSGELTTPRGNVTMIGYAVNQNGIARATTSVVSNGSVYLLAKDRAVSNTESTRGGRVVLGTGSLTEVRPDVADATGAQDGASAGAGLEKPSQVSLLGKEIEMRGGASIVAPAGEVKLLAQDNPGEGESGSSSPFSNGGASLISETARIRIMDGATIDVAGLRDVAVSAARNSVEVELRGDELKDSPINQQGPIRGEKVYVDLNRALANADAGQSTLISKDALESNQARLERTVAERSTAGGSVIVKSQGEALLESGARVDLSGGSVQYTAANVKTTLLSSNGRLIDISDADAETRYDGIATRYVIDYGRWNRQEVIDLGQSYRYDPGYVEGRDAGRLSVIGMKTTVMDAGVTGSTVTGALQRESGVQPAGARLMLGTGGVSGDYKLNQRVVIGTAMPAEVDTLALNPALFGEGRIGNLDIFTNQAAEVRDALRLPQGGSVMVIAKGVVIGADVDARGGRIEFRAADNAVNQVTVPLDVQVADGVRLNAAGSWANDLPSVSGQSPAPALVNGGTITLRAVGEIALGSDSVLNVDGGGRLKPNGKLVAGKGGNVTLDGTLVQLGGEVRGYALGKGGTYTLSSNVIHVGGAGDPAALNLDADFFSRGGFAQFNLTGVSGIDIADGTVLQPRVRSFELSPDAVLQPTHAELADFSTIVERDARVRQAANLSLTSNSPGDPAKGRIRLGENARILGDDRASISFSAKSAVTLLGEVQAAGGTITASLNRGENENFDPAASIWLGQSAVLDVSGAARTYTDSQGLTKGMVLDGGTVTLDAQRGYVVTEAGSRIDVSGAAPVRLDILNENGSLGQSVGSDAGSVRIATTEGALLDGTLAAHRGGTSNRGGSFGLQLAPRSDQTGTLPTNERSLILKPGLTAQVTGMAAGEVIPLALNGNSEIGTGAIEASGAERIAFTSEAIKLANGLDLGGGRQQPIREIALNGRLETNGGDAAVTAYAVRLGGLASSVEPVSGTGTLTVTADLLDIAGELNLSGMGKTVLKGEETVRFSASGTLKSKADLLFHGALVAPANSVHYTIQAPESRVDFARDASAQLPAQPLSAFGSLTVKAQDISQGGVVWAPLGQLAFEAENSLVFETGSLTSVAAEPGSVLPYGRLENGRLWVYGVDGSDIEIEALPQKSITTTALHVDMQDGAVVALSGGGDAQAYEFTVGPGGSRDILADANTYAILPGYAGGFAPADLQEGFDRAAGEAVYLSGVPGLDNGTYTLLPAHYALLPGAYAVKLDSGVGEVLPGQAYSRQDGVRIAAGYVTDTREGAPRDARWQGIQVMTRDQVRARSEFALTRASTFFADSNSRPQDAGRLAVSTLGSGPDALNLDAAYDLAAGTGGRGGQVDISALKITVTGGTGVGDDPDSVALDAATLNRLGADSLFIGGTRSISGDTTVLTVGADEITVANDAASALRGSEIMLAAKDTLTLKAGSAIGAEGDAGDAGVYEIAGNGAFVRAASTSASFARTGSPDRSQGTLIGETGTQDTDGNVIIPESTVSASHSIVLDATRDNAFKGAIQFTKDGEAVAGNLTVGAARISFGDASASSEGLVYSQADLDALDLASLTLTSYSTFDLYDDVAVGKLDASGKPVLNALTLQGAGLGGYDNAGKTAQLNARNLTLANAAGVAYSVARDSEGNELPQGNGALAITADTLTLGQGDKRIAGFDSVTVTANELVGSGKGALDVAGATTLNVARIQGEQGADQTLNAEGALQVLQHAADRALVPVTALGAKWALAGTSVAFDSKAELPSGSFKLAASTGDVNVGSNARIDVAGRSVQFFDVEKPSWGGTAEFVSENGDVIFAAPAEVDVNGNPIASVDVSAAAGGDAGKLIVRASNGTFTVATGSLNGAAPANAAGERGEGARADIDVGALDDFSALNAALNNDGGASFDGDRTLRVRAGDLEIASTDTVRAQNLRIALDDGDLDIAGTLDASGTDAGRIELYARGDVNVKSTASLKAASSGADANGGDIEIGTRDGLLDLASGSAVDLSGGANGRNGTLLLRATRTLTGVNVSALDSDGLDTARAVSVEAVKVYEGVTTLDASATSTGGVLGLAAIKADNATFAALHDAIKIDLGQSGIHVLSGVEVRSPGDLTLAADWNLKDLRDNGEAGMLTLRAAGNLLLNNNLSDGFNVATPLSGTVPATLLSDESWSYRLAGGADNAAANPLTVKAGSDSVNDVRLAAGKLVRTGTGNIRVASGSDIVFSDNKSAIYTAGRLADPVAGFSIPTGPTGAVNYAQFSHDGGDVELSALGDIASTMRSQQFYSQWLFRQGRLAADGSSYSVQPAWWVRFDQFQQGVGALGGGDLAIRADGKVENVSASAPTQARSTGLSPDANAMVTAGGGSVRVESGGDLLGGQYYADKGDIVLRVGGRMDTGEKAGTAASAKPLYTILALGDGTASVRANGDANIQAIVNPHLIVQASRNAGGASNNNISTTGDILSSSTRWSVFSTYSDESGFELASLNGDTVLHENVAANTSSASLQTAYSSTSATSNLLNFGISINNYNAGQALLSLPANLRAVSFQGNTTIDGSGALVLGPSATSQMELIAADTLSIRQRLVMSDAEPLPDPLRPSIKTNVLNYAALINPALSHAATPVHTGDPVPVRIYALSGDVIGKQNSLSLSLPKAVNVKAGRDVIDVGISAQHVDAGNNVSRIEAGRDVVFIPLGTGGRSNNAYVWIGGPGRLEVTAGRHIDLGASSGVVSRGNLDNTALPETGSDIHLAAGVGSAGIDYAGSVDRLISRLSGEIDDTGLWLARWLAGDDKLTSVDALAAVEALDAASPEVQRERVRSMLFTALRTSGRDANVADSGYAGDFARGYAALELLFPGVEERNPDGSFKQYRGDVNLFASRVLTERGGDIEFIVPGGDVIVGLANTPASLLATDIPGSGIGLRDAGVLGIASIDVGDVNGMARGDMLVNQSRILTVGGGDVLLWSSEGDIDAGKGKKSATVVPPPLTLVDAEGNVTQVLQGAASGSGIGALTPSGGTAGDVDLIAPRGTVNAGDAGIRAGNLNIAAQVVLGADNISASGTSTGTPVADTSAVTAASSGASNAGGDVANATAALSENLSEASQTAEELKKKFKPTFISAEVVGYGD